MQKIEILPWDSEFLGFKVGCVTLGPKNLEESKEILLNELAEAGCRLLYLFINHPDPSLASYAEALGAHLVDQKVTFTKRVFCPCSTDTGQVTSYTAPTLNETMLSLALQSGEFSRFKIDPNFSPGVFEKLYRIWIENSISRKIADEVFVVRDNGVEKGLITISAKNNEAVIGLLAVDTSFRNRSVGRTLIARVDKYCYENKIEILHVATQLQNTRACAFYEKNGFTLSKSVKIYHLWS